MKVGLFLFFVGVFAVSVEALYEISSSTLSKFGKQPFRTVKTRELEEKWITQKLDNFDPLNTATWQMRYFENDAYFKEGGSILIFIGGEWTIESGGIDEGALITDIAKEVGAVLFYTEHRYYGKSIPTPNASVKNMAFLSIDQALEDVAHFIRQIKATRPELKDAKVVVKGGSYSATMAAWMRQKYPDLVVGAWASSAPLHAKMNFFEYKEVVGQAVTLLGGQACYDRIQEAFTQMEELVASGDVQRINEEFDICQPLNVTDQLNVWRFFSDAANLMAGIVQGHKDREIQETCEEILDPKFEDGLAAYASWIRNLNYPVCAGMDYDEITAIVKEESWEAFANQGLRQWIYQTCAEFGWYQSSDSVNQPFGSLFPVELNFKYCQDIYGDEFTPSKLEGNARRINLLYGSYDPTATNVFYTHGQVDPWSSMGVLEDVSETSHVNIIPSVSHCKDLGSIDPEEDPALTESKQLVTKFVKQWLGL